MEFLLILIYIEFIIGFIVLPVLFGIARRRGFKLSEKQFAFSVSTYVSILIFTGNIYSVYLLIPANVSSLRGWLLAIVLSLVTWLFTYPLSRWLYKQFFQ
jgi:hypothetical protein